MKPYTEVIRRIYPDTSRVDYIAVVPHTDGLPGLTEILEYADGAKIANRITVDVDTIPLLIAALQARYAEADKEEGAK